jgi:uncharacterized protein
VILIDANLLLYAYDASSAQHDSARHWLESTLTEEEEVALSWVAVLAFLRIATSRHALGSPFTINEATDIMDSILSRSNVRVLTPGSSHWQLFRKLLIDSHASANLATDAHIAALALEHDCVLATSDKDFTRFAGLKIVNPIAKQ